MGNFICATVILILMVIFISVNSVMVCNICDEITALIDENDLEAAAELWQEKKNYISLFVRDAEIDVVTAEAMKAEGSTPIEDAESAPNSLAFRDAVAEVKNSELFSWQGLL